MLEALASLLDRYYAGEFAPEDQWAGWRSPAHRWRHRILGRL